MNALTTSYSMKEDPRIVSILNSQPRIRRVGLMRSIGNWINRPIPYKISTGPCRALICHCPIHDEKSPSFRMWSTGSFYCFGCCFAGDWIDLIIHFYQPADTDELLRLARQFIRGCGSDSDQAIFDFMRTSAS